MISFCAASTEITLATLPHMIRFEYASKEKIVWFGLSVDSMIDAKGDTLQRSAFFTEM